MANTNSPFGLRPLGVNGAAQPTFQLANGKIAAGNTHTISRGSLLIRLNTGYLDQWTAGQPVSYAVGVFWGSKYLSSALNRTTQNTYWPGGDSASDVTVYYIPFTFPSPLFVVQANAAAIPFSAVGLNADLVVGTDTVKGSLGVSGATLNSTPGTTATLPFRIEGLWSDYAPATTPGTDNTSPYNLVVVSANTAQSTGI
jgi:hypothetical protein